MAGEPSPVGFFEEGSGGMSSRLVATAGYAVAGDCAIEGGSPQEVAVSGGEGEGAPPPPTGARGFFEPSGTGPGEGL